MLSWSICLHARLNCLKKSIGLIYLSNNQGPETQENNGRIQKHIHRYHGNFGGIPPQTLKGKKGG